MTQQEKDILIGKMLDPEATLTDAELRLILADADLREIHEVSAAVMGASIQPAAIDVEKEWRLFRHKIHPKPSRWRLAMRVAAIFLGVLFVSAIVRIGIDRLMTDDSPSIYSSEAATTSNVASTLRVRPRASEPTPSMYSPEAAVSSNATATLRVGPHPVRSEAQKTSQEPYIPKLTVEEEMEVDEYLRLQQARIDNELAMMQAELRIGEMLALAPPVPTDEGGEEFTSQEEGYIIMQ